MNCVRSVDGKHIRMQCPQYSGSLFYNYKKYYNIELMAVADHLYRFTLVDIGACEKKCYTNFYTFTKYNKN